MQTMVVRVTSPTPGQPRVRCRPPSLSAQRHERREERHRHLRRGRQLQLPSNDHRFRRTLRHQQRERYGRSNLVRALPSSPGRRRWQTTRPIPSAQPAWISSEILWRANLPSPGPLTAAGPGGPSTVRDSTARLLPTPEPIRSAPRAARSAQRSRSRSRATGSSAAATTWDRRTLRAPSRTTPVRIR